MIKNICNVNIYDYMTDDKIGKASKYYYMKIRKDGIGEQKCFTPNTSLVNYMNERKETRGGKDGNERG